MLPKYRQQTPKPPDEDFSPQMVMASSTEIYSFYRLTFAQCAKLSTGAPLLELSKVFSKYLDQYAQQVLLSNISERPSGQTPSRFPSIEDTIIVLNTADYCYNTCTQLEEKIKSRIDDPLRNSVDLQSQADAFMGVASASIRGLVRKVEADLEPAWREMRNSGWSKLQSVSDHSGYVTELLQRVKARAGEIIVNLHKSQYARAFCDNLIEALASAYTANIVQCRPLSEIGAEQVRDSTHLCLSRPPALTKFLLDAPRFLCTHQRTGRDHHSGLASWHSCSCWICQKSLADHGSPLSTPQNPSSPAITPGSSGPGLPSAHCR